MSDNETKKTKATKKAVEEVKDREQMEKEIELLMEEIASLQVRKTDIESQLSKYLFT